jgi:hypothetical protein
MILSLLLLFSSVAQAGWVLDDYKAFRDGGCDAEDEGIYSPIVLRVLSSTPWAVAGKDFQYEDLHALFTADGDWFRALPGKSVKISNEDMLCVAKIREWEGKQRQMHCIEDADQATITSRIDVYRWHRQEMGLPELHRYIRGMIPEERPLRSACMVSEMTRESSGGRWVDWSVSTDRIRRPTSAMLMADYRRLFPDDEAGEPSADYMDRMKRWERQYTAVERLQWTAVQVEGNPGDLPFRRKDQGICYGNGSFMDQSWFCLEAGSF